MEPRCSFLFAASVLHLTHEYIYQSYVFVLVGIYHTLQILQDIGD